jgi:hypothetical protein
VTIRAVSYGGGVQSTALLVLAAERRIDFPLFLMANVGDDSEHPDTLAFVRLFAQPWADEQGIEMHVLERKRRDGSAETLMGRLIDPKKCPVCKGVGSVFTDRTDDSAVCAGCEGIGLVESRSLPIPVRMSNGAPGNRSCTADFKIAVTGKELKRRGATADNPATIGIGISLDEIQRAANRKVDAHERVVYPLIGIGEETGLKLRRSDCERVIRETVLSPAMTAHARSVADGLPPKVRQQLERTGFTRFPIPPKSSCYFCPFHKEAAWSDLARDRPDLFEKSVQLERTLNKRRAMLGKAPVFLTRFARPLDEVINDGQELLPLLSDDAGCDSGWCMT